MYLVRTRTGALYTGITTDVARRLDEHQRQSGPGAKSLRARGPLTLVYTVAIGGRGLASKTEYAFKRLSKAEKEGLVRTQPCRASLLQHLGIDVAAASPAAADTAGPERE